MILQHESLQVKHQIVKDLENGYFYVARISDYHKHFSREHIIFYVCSIWMFGYAVHVPNHLGWGEVRFSQLFHFCTFDTESLSYKLFYGGMLALAIVLAFVFYAKIYLVLRHTTLARHMILNKQGGNKVNGLD
uniref:Uncharacterized protein n=1 Tax=Romanomermis culicivorax TaxID=13658 RepID=A0A915K0C3_ROMCU